MNSEQILFSPSMTRWWPPHSLAVSVCRLIVGAACTTITTSLNLDYGRSRYFFMNEISSHCVIQFLVSFFFCAMASDRRRVHTNCVSITRTRRRCRRCGWWVQGQSEYRCSVFCVAQTLENTSKSI